MRRWLALAVVIGLCVLGAASALDDRELAFEVGLPAVRVAGELERGARLCRTGIDVPAAFERVRLVVGTFGRPGSELGIVVTDERSGRRVASGAVPAGYPDNSSVETAVGDVPAGGRVRVCVRNAGADRVALFGVPPNTPPDDLADPDLEARPAIVFLREPPASMLGLLPDAFERAARFKLGGLGPWTVWMLLAVVALGVPLALARALSAAYASERSSSSDRELSERPS